MARGMCIRSVALLCGAFAVVWTACADGLNREHSFSLTFSSANARETLSDARLLLSSGNDQEVTAATAALEKVYWHAQELGMEGQRVAVEAASCLAIFADRMSRSAEASQWFARASQAADGSALNDLPPVLRLAEAAVAPEGGAYEAAMRRALLGLPMLVTSFAADPQQQDSPDHAMSIKALKRLVVPDRLAFERAPSLENKIKLLTSLILFGEIASRPDEQLFADANEAFHEGLTLLAEVENELREKPGEDRKLSENRPLAVRFDVIRFRQVKVREKHNTSLKADRERTKTLQSLVMAYRDMAGDLASAMSSHLAGDEPDSLARIDRAIGKTKEINAVIDSDRDFYLLTPEPAILAKADPDVEIIYNRVSPFTPRLSSECFVVRGLSRFRTPLPEGQAKNGDRITASLDDVRRGLAEDAAGDSENVLGYYAFGIMHEARGDLLLDSDATDKAARGEATDEFAKARDSYVKFLEVAKGALRAEVENRLAILTGFKAVLDRARDETKNGDVSAASRTLAAGIRRHNAVEVWAAWAAAAARAGEGKHTIRITLEKAAAAGFLDATDPVFVVAAGRAVIDDVIAQTSGTLEKLNAKQRAVAAVRLTTVLPTLRVASATLNESEKAVCEAFMSLAVAYRGILLEQTAAGVQTDFAEAYAMCKTAHETLSSAIQANTAEDPVALQEGLVACRLALGYLATATVPDFQDDAIAAFSGVLDEQSRLPGDRADLKVMGAPLVSALRDRPLNAGKESVNYEQRLRRSMVSLLDGAVSLKYGVPEESSRFLEEGLSRLRSRSADADVSPDAAQLFNDSDTFEVERYLEDFMSVFAVLADIEAGRGAEALRKSIRRVDPDALKGEDDLPPDKVFTVDILERALECTKSPMALYAVGRAVEAYALTLELSNDAKEISGSLLQVGRKAIADAKAATTPWLASRYPAFVRLLEDSESKLAGPENYLALARQLRGQGRLDDAVAELHKAVRLYRESRDLWRLWVEVELARAVDIFGKARDKGRALRGLTEVIASGRANGAFSAADELYFNAVVDDRLGNIERAIDQYSRAVGQHDLDRVYRVRAKSRLAVLKLKAGPLRQEAMTQARVRAAGSARTFSKSEADYIVTTGEKSHGERHG